MFEMCGQFYMDMIIIVLHGLFQAYGVAHACTMATTKS